MNTITARINLVLKETKVTKSELARKLKISPSAVTQICSGKNNPSEQTITLICKEFGLNEEWLRSGKGEMFAVQQEDILEEMAAAHGLSPDFAAIMKRLMKLPPDVQDQIVEAVFAAADEIQRNRPETETPYQRDARLLREEADAVEQEGERLSASDLRKDA